MGTSSTTTEPARSLRGSWVIAETGRLTLTWELPGDSHSEVAPSAEVDLAA